MQNIIIQNAYAINFIQHNQPFNAFLKINLLENVSNYNVKNSFTNVFSIIEFKVLCLISAEAVFMCH